MYCLTDTCFLCVKNNIKVQSVMIQDTDGIVVNEKLRYFFPKIIDSTPDAYKLSCSECLEKLRISYDFKQSVIRNNTAFRNYIEKLQGQHKSQQQLARSKHRTNLPFTRDITAQKVKKGDDNYDKHSLKIQIENLNLTSTNQQLNTYDLSCQHNTNENDAFITKFSCQTKEINLETENIATVDVLREIEEIYIKEEPLIDDNFTSNYLDEDCKESDDSTSPSSESEHNEHPQHKDTKKGQYKCSECLKAFTYPSKLERHRRIHSGEKPYKCQICPKTFTQIQALHRHKLTHTGEQPHQCDICNKTFNDRSNFIRHKRSHANIRPYLCSVCSKSFTRSFDLGTHMRIHTGETPYQCKHCQKSFIRSSYLNAHLRKFHT